MAKQDGGLQTALLEEVKQDVHFPSWTHVSYSLRFLRKENGSIYLVLVSDFLGEDG